MLLKVLKEALKGGNGKATAQGYTEYVVILAAVLAIASIVVATIQLIGNVYQRQQGRINALP